MRTVDGDKVCVKGVSRTIRAADPVFTESQRAAAASYGLCKDEFTDTGYWPPQLYVRESRRMQGLVVITQNDIISNPSKPDPIMVSSFPIDSHDVSAHPGNTGEPRRRGRFRHSLAERGRKELHPPGRDEPGDRF
ncbi:MAG: FAD-dependent oxidoreductase [Lentisphaerae bacterium]|nr:FAD-dependent oxidoreductase [Lentisphaerota bacterium]